MNVPTPDEEDRGPVSWMNWRAALRGAPAAGWIEDGLYTDAWLLGEPDRLGPYQFINAVAHAEFINLEDAFNFELNRSGKNGGEFEGGWTPKKYDAFVQWVGANPARLKMRRAEFDAILAERKKR